MSLADKKCVPCEGGGQPLAEDEVESYLKALAPEWHLNQERRLRRAFAFKNFAAAMEFVNQVAAVAESENHHPDITINYNRVTLLLWTHALGGLSENDFILAAKIDQI